MHYGCISPRDESSVYAVVMLWISASKTPLFSPQIPRLLLRYVTHILNASNNNGLSQSWDTISGRCTGEQAGTMAVYEHPLTRRIIGQRRGRNVAFLQYRRD